MRCINGTIINKNSKHFIKKLSNIEEAMYSVYQYGIQMAFEVGCSFIMSIIICCACGQMIDGIIFLEYLYH